MSVRVQSDPFDPGQELSQFSQLVTGAGAIVTFTGVVRDEDGSLDHMLIEHYPAMTGPAIEAIETQAVSRWDLQASLVIHRYGTLAPGDHIMMVATVSRHRANAFSAAEFLMDYLKSRAPFWKKEFTADGASWVAAKDKDEDALKRW
ncbi:MAG: molybdenum cofactor biosynthesis protein MoaE [Marinosulfonomonas sp.]|nr:molybdenum cofactor biosynthesis protein MoaE [Marinosulfonomonas sp.]